MYHQAITKLKNLESKIDSLQAKLKNLPEGKLICTYNAPNWKWYISSGHGKAVYLPKKEREIAKKLAKKKYLSLQLNHALQEERALNFYLRHHNEKADSAEIDFLNAPQYKELLKEYLAPVSDDLTEWQNSLYEKNSKHSETLIHKAPHGNLVRSKSEAMIALYLSKNQIPFHYEEVLHLTDPINGAEVEFYPDFTIRHPKTKEFFYWEHFGMMDDPNYIRSTSSKLQLYFSNGILPGHQLITTYETKNHPLDSEMIEQVLKRYFGDDIQF